MNNLIMILDTETTGLPKNRSSSIYNTNEWPYVLQLSFIIFNKNSLQIDFSYNKIIKVDDEIIIPQESTNIHGINRQMSNSGINILDALTTLNKYINEVSSIIGHNVSFDKKVLLVEFIRHNIKSMFPHKPMICTMINYRKQCNITKTRNTEKKTSTFIKFPTLTELYFYTFASIPTNLHNSYNDILITLRCYIYLEYEIDLLHTSDTFFNEFNQNFPSTSLTSIYY